MKELIDFLIDKEDILLSVNLKIKLSIELTPNELEHDIKSLYFSYSNVSKHILKLPDNMHIHGYVSLYGCKTVVELPKKLVIDDYLSIQGSRVTKLPDDLIVKNEIYVDTHKEDLYREKYPRFADQIR